MTKAEAPVRLRHLAISLSLLSHFQLILHERLRFAVGSGIGVRTPIVLFSHCTHWIYFGNRKKGSTTAVLLFGEPSGIRTPDTLIKSQVLYQLS